MATLTATDVKANTVVTVAMGATVHAEAWVASMGITHTAMAHTKIVTMVILTTTLLRNKY